MKALIYDELVPWYRLLDPCEDHEEEAVAFIEAFDRVVTPRPETLLELGAGAGHNGFFLKRRYRCTLTDLSPAMQGLSREINPECEHIVGDMRTLRLDRTFDVVLVHDAIVYMTSESDLAAAAATAFVHTRPGGAAIVAPDCVAETFADHTELYDEDDGPRSMCTMEWTWDPDPADQTYTVDYAFLLRDGTDMRAVHDRHIEGLFPRATWVRILTEAGFQVGPMRRPIGGGETDEIFLCRRPGLPVRE